MLANPCEKRRRTFWTVTEEGTLLLDQTAHRETEPRRDRERGNGRERGASADCVIEKHRENILEEV